MFSRRLSIFFSTSLAAGIGKDYMRIGPRSDSRLGCPAMRSEPKGTRSETRASPAGRTKASVPTFTLGFAFAGTAEAAVPTQDVLHTRSSNFNTCEVPFHEVS